MLQYQQVTNADPNLPPVSISLLVKHCEAHLVKNHYLRLFMVMVNVTA